MSFLKYPRYIESGVSWLQAIPEHWKVRRLKHVCSMFSSNVDKKSVEGQPAVKLCNYTDVYYNEEIHDGLDFMRATATQEQIEKFTLKEGDTLITKDSESPDDIAIPAFVPRTLPGVICGYHLAVIRPKSGVNGRFVSRLFQSSYVKAKCHVGANGLTRYGLSQAALNDLEFPVPPLAEQITIASFLDQETSKIDALISEQQRLIELLKEKRQAVISHAVTKGVNPDVRMKPSGVEWLGEVPEHWEVGPVKRFFSSLNYRRIPLSSEERSSRQGEYPYYGASGVIDSVDDFLFEEDLVLVSEDGANLLNRSTPISFVATGKYWVNNHAHIIKPQDENVYFWAARLEAIDLAPFVTGSAQPKFTAEALQNLVIAVPPTEAERSAIQSYILSSSEGIEPLLVNADRAVGLLQERRTALISAAVTGKIDVRNYASTQKDAA